MRIDEVNTNDMPEVARRGPCEGEKCVAEGVERMFSRQFLCDDCCDKESKAEWEAAQVTVQYSDTDGETHIITGLPADAAVESIGYRGCALAGDVKVLDNDPLAELWKVTDEGKLTGIVVGVSPGGSCGEFVKFSFSTLYPVSDIPTN